MDADQILTDLGLDPAALRGGDLEVTTPVDGSRIATLRSASTDDAGLAMRRAATAFEQWRSVPAPRRGELVRLLGEELRANKEQLSRLVTLECGKILTEGRGEVQEMIDVCDLAVGQSRQLYGLTIASERPGHAMRETWHPLGPAVVISAFNFPVAVWSWNAALALVCGDPVVWKPSEKTPLTALAVLGLFERAVARFGDDAPEHLVQVVVGGPEVGEALVTDDHTALVSATGSTRMGRAVAAAAAPRFTRTILELGGNNAMVVQPSADLDLALRAVVFSAVGTAGQRCTSLRRVLVHEDVADDLLERLAKVYDGLPVGDPLADGTLVGPLVDQQARDAMDVALAAAVEQGGRVVHGGEHVSVDGCAGGAYVRPAIVEMPGQTPIVQQETFAPVLYVLRHESLDDAIATHNDVPQGLSSCIFTTDVREAERFVSAVGSDCGIANVNIGPSGAEIGGAFGGEKDTGGGRESGSDAWKGYMRRQTATVNWSTDLPLAQGVSFDV